MTTPAHWLQPAVHPAYARVLCVMLRKQGVDLPRLLAGTGLSWAQLLDASHGISFAQLRSLIHSAMMLGASPLLGMELGAALPVSAHGQVGYAAMASKNVGQAFDVITRYSRLRSNVLAFRLLPGDDHCRLQIRESFDLADVRIPVMEAVMVLAVRVIEALVGYPPEQMEYRLPYPAPPWHAAYGARLAGKIEFDAPCLELIFPCSLLTAPCLTADPFAYAAARRDCEQGLAQLALEGDLLPQMRARLQGQEGEYPGCAAMAAELHMSARTLMRRLKQRGTSYQALLDDVRKERAQWFLLHTSQPVESIAARLGYLDTSNFSRTFRRWFGVSPKEFRRASKGTGSNQA